MEAADQMLASAVLEVRAESRTELDVAKGNGRVAVPGGAVPEAAEQKAAAQLGWEETKAEAEATAARAIAAAEELEELMAEKAK